MRVSEIMSSPVIMLDKDRSLVDAVYAMEKEKISRVVVTEKDQMVGILTEKDIMRELGSSHAYRLPPQALHISNAMTRGPISVEKDLMAKRAAELMLDHDVSGLPVAEQGKVVGIVTKMDFAKVCANYDEVYIGQVMQLNPMTVSTLDRVIHARRLLLEEELVALPIMEGARLVGIITARDIAMKLAAFQQEAPDRTKSERIRYLLVGDVMTQSATTVRTDDRLSAASRLMLERRFSALPVENLDGKMVGLLTKTELTEVARERL